MTTSGELWKEHRSFALTTLRNFGFGKRSLENQIKEEIELFLNDISDTDGKPFDIQSILSISVSNVICSMAFGRHYDHNDKRLLLLLKMMNENLSTSAGIMNLLPWLRHLPGDPFGSKILLERMEHIFDFLREIVEEHRKTLDEDNIRDYIDAFLVEQKRKANVKDNTFTGINALFYSYKRGVRFSFICLSLFVHVVLNAVLSDTVLAALFPCK